MGKKSKSQTASVVASDKAEASLPFLGGNASVDPGLASLFEKSAGPVKIPSVSTSAAISKLDPNASDDESAEEGEASDSEERSADEDEVMQETSEVSDDFDTKEASEVSSRKRKRTNTEDLEETYMRRIAKEEEKESEKRRAEKTKRQKVEDEDGAHDDSNEDDASEQPQEEESSEEEEEGLTVPKHETQSGDANSPEIEKSNRTIFLGNVSNEAIKSKTAKKILMKHVGSFLSTLPESSGPHKVESIRFRSTAFASGGRVPKRAAFTKRELLDDTTPSTNAYVVYSTLQAARKAPAALNGTVVLDRHLRVDSVAHPSKIDNRRCVFVGNLDFVDHEAAPEEDEEKKKKKKSRAPADVEEGLWRTFNAHTTGTKENKVQGNVESVRVIRDRATRVGKGFAYVQFYDQNCVEEALLLNGKKFPPMLPRNLRVTRAKKIVKKREETAPQQKALRDADKTLQGRAGQLFGKAGAAKVKTNATKSISQNSLVFEGHRATKDGSSRIRVKTKSRGSKGKPNGRSTRRAAAYRASGGKKGKTG
ncbi:rRNA-processing protein NOP12 [Aspergillus tanneri]|uniref:Nucleolar protein 12 n=1 Tax=Aspergillus tanneri TaxID=1220188 RepID=A0A5M9M672_9EURO|nr:Nucleolar protein 12 [Aspergillus tanneri]KAA8642231.1 Nucleolar protein 12 [Aspergillus tanneri]